MKVDAFKDAYKKKFEDMFAVPYTSGSTTEQFQALGQLLRSIYTDKWVHYNQVKLDSKQKQVFYFSMEFLPGRLGERGLGPFGFLLHGFHGSHWRAGQWLRYSLPLWALQAEIHRRLPN